jgi:hypothetical protein
MPPSTATITDEQLLAITQDSQEFADLKMPDKLRFFTLQNAALRSQNSKLTESMPDSDGLRITDKGVLSLSVPNSWPASYYRDQWAFIINKIEAIKRVLDKDASGARKIVNKPPKEKK